MRFLCSKCGAVLTGDFGAAVDCGKCGARVSAPETLLAPGAVFGDFAIERELGRGGVGVVYLARQLSLDRPVALKVLQGKFAQDKEFVDGFIREARVAAKISHPNIVQAYAVGEEDGNYYFAMEYVDGSTMKKVLKERGTIDPKTAAGIVRDIADALECAWSEQKLVHQDIKPDNIMLTHRGQAKLADLGLAKIAALESVDEDEDEVMGTPQYISPEQLTGAPTDVRSDIYSLGATFYHLLTGRFPYLGKDGNEIARQHVEGTLTPPIEIVKSLPPELNRIVLKMMDKDINHRYQQAADLSRDLGHFLDGGGSAAPATKLGGVNASGAKLGDRRMNAPKLGDHAAASGPKLAASSEVKLNLTPSGAAPAAAAAAPETPAAAAKPMLVKPTLTGAPAGAKIGISVKKPPAPPKPAEPEPSAAPEAPAAPDAKGTRGPVAPPKKKGKAAALAVKNEPAADDDKALPPMVAEAERRLREKPKFQFRMPPALKKIFTALLVLVILLALVAGGAYAAVRFKLVPQKFKPQQDKVLAMLKLKVRPDGSIVPADAAAAPTAEKPAGTAPSTASQTPAATAAPKVESRLEYLDGIETLLTQIRSNPAGEMEFLEAADLFFSRYPAGPVTREEQEALRPLLTIYARLDDSRRMVPSRRRAQQRHREAALARLDAAEQARREQEAQLATARATAEKAGELARETLADDQAGEAERRARLMPRAEPYIAGLEAGRGQLAYEFFQRLRNGDPRQWESLVRQLVETTRASVPVDALKEERDAAEQTVRFATGLNREFEQMRKVVDILNNPEMLSRLMIELPRRVLVRARSYNYDTGVLETRTAMDKVVPLDLKRPLTRRRFVERFEHKFKLKGVDLALAMASCDFGRVPPDRLPPFWKEQMPAMTSGYLRNAWSRADEAGRAELRKRFEKLPEFEQAVR